MSGKSIYDKKYIASTLMLKCITWHKLPINLNDNVFKHSKFHSNDEFEIIFAFIYLGKMKLQIQYFFHA